MLLALVLGAVGTVALSPAAAAEDDTCDNLNGLPCEPGVLTAQVEMRTSVNFSIPDGQRATVPLSGAYWELEYYGLDVACTGTSCEGDLNDRRWRLMTSGHLDRDGRADISSYYPRNWSDGTTNYFRCDPDFTRPQWNGYYPCKPGLVRVRVYARNESGSVRVEDAPDVESLANELYVTYFWEFDGRQVVTRNLPGGLAYAAAHTVGGVWPGEMADVKIRLLPAGPQPPHYDPQSRTVFLTGPDTFTSAAERFVAERQLHHLYGHDFPGLPGSQAVSFQSVSNEQHAFARGLADFIASTAERRHLDDPRLYDRDKVKLNVERCAVEPADPASNPVPCADGPSVAGRVTATLSDLADTANERIDSGGLDDRSSGFTLSTLVGHLGVHRPQTMDELWPHVRGSTATLETFWLNSLRRPVFEDVAGTGGIAWSTQACDTCLDHGVHRSDPSDLRPTARWNLGSLQAEGWYDVWVRLPRGDSSLDPRARYEIRRPTGTRTVEVDQAAVGDGWHNLTPDGEYLTPSGSLELVLAPSASAHPVPGLVADAVIVTPHDGEGQPNPPVRVTATGTVEVWRNEGGTATTGLAGARYEALYYDGSQWRPLTDGPGGTGTAITGTLDADGGYSATFYYPNYQYRLPDGTWWRGCPDPQDGVRFADGHACRASELVIRVHPENGDRSVRVFAVGADSVEPGWDAHIGRFFEEQGTPQQHIANSPTASAYGAVVNMSELVGAATLGQTTIRLINESETSRFDPATATVYLRANAADTTIAEHELGHQLQWRLYGYMPPIPGCSPHGYMLPSSAQCAFVEGFAHFVAVASENDPGSSDWSKMTTDSGHQYDIENCATIFPSGAKSSCPTAVPDTRRIEGWVAAALWDLFDESPTEAKSGLPDLKRYSMKDHILPVIEQRKPETYDQFFAAWKTAMHAGRDDHLISFLNHQLYQTMRDAVNVGTGWSVMQCTCLGDSAWVLKAGTPTTSFARWDLGSQVKPGAKYHVWVNNPATVRGDRDSRARYTVTTATGPVSFILDQNTRPGWNLLTTEPLQLGSGAQVKLTSGSNPTRAIAADSIILVPADAP